MGKVDLRSVSIRLHGGMESLVNKLSCYRKSLVREKNDVEKLGREDAMSDKAVMEHRRKSKEAANVDPLRKDTLGLTKMMM